MLAPLLLPIALAAPLMAAPASCAGPDPAITGAVVASQSMQPGGLNSYTIAITVQNMGTKGQPSNLLQSVEVMQNGDHVDQKGLQPLRPGQKQTVMYTFTRSHGAAPHTTRFTFTLAQKGMSIPGPQDCSADNDTFRLTV
jgi:hypothetical protein